MNKPDTLEDALAIAIAKALEQAIPAFFNQVVERAPELFAAKAAADGGCVGLSEAAKLAQCRPEKVAKALALPAGTPGHLAGTRDTTKAGKGCAGPRWRIERGEVQRWVRAGGPGAVAQSAVNPT